MRAIGGFGEVGNVRTDQQVDAGLRFVALLLIILCELLADLARSGANDRVLAGVIVRRAVEHLDSKRPLFELSGLSGQGLLDDVADQGLAPFASTKLRAAEDS